MPKGGYVPIVSSTPGSGGFPEAVPSSIQPEASTKHKTQTASAPISWADGERPWYGAIDPVQVQDIAADPENPLSGPLPSSFAKQWRQEQRERCRIWVIGGSLLALATLAGVLLVVVLFGSRPQRPELSEQPTSSADPRGSLVLAAAPGDSQWVPDGPWTIGAPMGCLEAKCEGHMAALGKAFADHENLKLLDCIQRTGMSNEDTVACFRVSQSVERSDLRSGLYECGLCKRCIQVEGEEAADHCAVGGRNEEDQAGRSYTPSSSSGSSSPGAMGGLSWQNTIPPMARSSNGISWRAYVPGWALRPWGQ